MIIFIQYNNFLLFHLLCYFRVERSKVRVTFFENSKPQVISSPEFNSLIQYGDTVFGETFTNSQKVYVNGDLIQLSGDQIIDDNSNNNKMVATVTEIPPNYDRQQRYVKFYHYFNIFFCLMFLFNFVISCKICVFLRVYR